MYLPMAAHYPVRARRRTFTAIRKEASRFYRYFLRKSDVFAYGGRKENLNDFMRQPIVLFAPGGGKQQSVTGDAMQLVKTKIAF